MDNLLRYPLIDPTNDNYPFNFSYQAQHLLQQLGWTYYTIWKTDTTHHLPGLAWSWGDVNELQLVADENNLNNVVGSTKMGLLLLEFYMHCSFLHLGLGMAGEAFASGQYRWASGEELLEQIKLLSRQNQQPASLKLQSLPALIKTVVYIPLQNGAGVLEIGTKELVPERDAIGMISQIQMFIDGLAITRGSSRGEQIMSTSFAAGTNDVGNQYIGDPDEQYYKTNPSVREIYGDRAISGRPSNSSSYCSPSSTASSSTPTAGDRKGNISNTTFVLSTINNEDRLMSPASSLQDTPLKSTVKSFDEVNILKQLDHIDMQDVSTPLSLQEFDSYRLNTGEVVAPSHLSGHNQFSSRDVLASPPSLSLMDNSRYAYPHSDNNDLFDCEFQPMQCVSNEQVDGHHCFNEIVEGPSYSEPNMKCLTTSCNIQLTAERISCLPSETFQHTSHSDSYSNDQQQQWTYMFPGVNEGEEMSDLFGQSGRNTHAMAPAGISKIPLAEYSLADKRSDVNIDNNIMPEQGAALMIENEGNRRLIRGMSSTNAEAYEVFINHKMSREQGGKMVVISSTVPFTTQAAGSYASYTSGSAEADKEATGRYIASCLAKDYKVVGTSASQLAGGSYVSYAPASAEAEKVVGPSTVFLSRHDAGRRAGDQYRQVQQGTELQKLHGVQDDLFIASSLITNIGTPHDMSHTNFVQHDIKTEHHKYAERDRRRKHGHCIDTLRTLLPNITKKDPKTTILQSTIQHIKELNYRICELEQENRSKDQKKSRKDSSDCVSNSQQATNVKSSTQNISSQENATCRYIPSSSVENLHFQLNLIKNVQDIKVNTTIIEILDSLQNKNLCCYKLNYEFCKINNQLFVNISANYKDGRNFSPTLDEIQGIKEWWDHILIKE